MNVQLVVFDLCGTTVRDEDVVSRHLRATLIAAGVEVTREEVGAVMGTPREVALRELLHLRRGRAPAADLITMLHEDFVERMIRYYGTAPGVGEMPGATYTFRELRRRGVRVALETGFCRRVMDVILRRLNWVEGVDVDATLASDEVLRGRPHPDSIYAAMRRTGVAQVQAVAKVGDTPVDLQAGRAAGCGWVVGVASDCLACEDMLASPDTRLIESLTELLPVLGVPECRRVSGVGPVLGREAVPLWRKPLLTAGHA